MPLVLMLLYLLGACAAVLVPLYVARLVINDFAIPALSNAETAKGQVAAAPVAPGPDRPPVWIAPTRDYKTASSAPAESAMAKELPKRKKGKKP